MSNTYELDIPEHFVGLFGDYLFINSYNRLFMDVLAYLQVYIPVCWTGVILTQLFLYDFNLQ